MMATRFIGGVLLVATGLGVAGCDRLCELGIDTGSCAPCEAASIPEAWKQAHLEPLLPGDDAVVCEASFDDKGSGTLNYWAPGSVHDANMAAVSAAQDSGWDRLEDNWYGTSGDFDTPKWSTLGLKRGDALRIDVHAEKPGARVVMKVAAFPEPPELRGDATVFTYKGASFAMQDGQLAVLPGVTGGVVQSFEDGFLFGHAHKAYKRYEPDGSITDLGEFPHEGSGSLADYGPGPDGGPWLVFRPGSEQKVVFGSLVDGAWSSESFTDFDPPLPTSNLDVARTDSGRVWMTIYDALYVKDGDTWTGVKLPQKTSAIYGFIAQGESVLYPTNKGVVRASFEGGEFKWETAVKMSNPKLRDAGALGVVARNDRKSVLIGPGEVTPLELPGAKEGPSIATSDAGVIAVATTSPSTVLVRGVDGTITRYPADGALPDTVSRMEIDPNGRVWALMKASNPVVAVEGRVEVIPGLVADGAQPYRISFMGNGAEPRLEMPAE